MSNTSPNNLAVLGLPPPIKPRCNASVALSRNAQQVLSIFKLREPKIIFLKCNLAENYIMLILNIIFCIVPTKVFSIFKLREPEKEGS